MDRYPDRLSTTPNLGNLQFESNFKMQYFYGLLAVAALLPLEASATLRGISYLTSTSPFFPRPPPRCKVIPGDREWPSPASWNVLKAAVGGRLINPIPPAAVCHEEFEGKQTYDAAKCQEVTTEWSGQDF